MVHPDDDETVETGVRSASPDAFHDVARASTSGPPPSRERGVPSSPGTGMLAGMPERHPHDRQVLTTVKVTTRTRERLAARARQDGVTIGQVLERLLSEEDRSRRFSAVADAYRRTADGVYRRETADWDVTLSDGSAASGPDMDRDTDRDMDAANLAGRDPVDR